MADKEKLLWAPSLQWTRALTIILQIANYAKLIILKLRLHIILLHYVIIINIIIIVEARLVLEGVSGFRVYIQHHVYIALNYIVSV